MVLQRTALIKAVMISRYTGHELVLHDSLCNELCVGFMLGMFVAVRESAINLVSVLVLLTVTRLGLFLGMLSLLRAMFDRCWPVSSLNLRGFQDARRGPRPTAHVHPAGH